MFKDFSFFNMGGHLVYRSRTILALKLLISQSKFSGHRKFTLKYQ